MKTYLINTFNYNNWANTKLLETILQLPDNGEAVRLFSHLINAQNKWLNRIERKVEDSTLNWLEPLYAIDGLRDEWKVSTGKWIAFLNSLTNEEEVEQNITFIRPGDGKLLSVKIVDIALQLNYHSIHHRAQINKLISAQGVPVPATDYIFTVLKEV